MMQYLFGSERFRNAWRARPRPPRNTAMTPVLKADDEAPRAEHALCEILDDFAKLLVA